MKTQKENERAYALKQAQLSEKEQRDKELNDLLRRSSESIQQYKASHPNSSLSKNSTKSSGGYSYGNDPYGAEKYKTADDFADDWEDDFDDWDEAYDYWEDAW